MKTAAAPVRTSTNAAREHYLAEFARLSPDLPGRELEWLARARRSALASFAERGLPTRHDEDWKYTSVAAFERHDFCANNDATVSGQARALVREHANVAGPAHLMVFCNGRHVPELSDMQPVNGMRLLNLAELLESAPHVLEPWLLGQDIQHAFSALNTAFLRDGAFLHLARNTVIEQPVHLLFVATEAMRAGFLRNLIVAEAGAQATVVEHYLGTDEAPYFTSAVTRVYAHAGAHISHIKLQREGNEAFHFGSLISLQQRDSHFASHSISLGAALARHDILTRFEDSGCNATLDGLYVAAGTQHVDHHTTIDHRSPHGTSREHYRGVLGGGAHAVFNGKVIVQPGAQKTDAMQSNHNLLLSREAEVDTKPELEIYADDVKCNHGATVGQLDEQQLFYLRARGVDEAAARAMLVHAFASEVVARIPVAPLRERLQAYLLNRLPTERA